MNLIWATRGRVWGFRFLLDGGFSDPLPKYEEAFLGVADEMKVFHRTGELVALRFPDPLGRVDAASRIIPHDFVVLGPLAEPMESVDDGLRLIWRRPEVADEYARIWDLAKPPAAKG
ncbi:hypothetical protein [Asanoa sp. NPDC050611]|uniref:hypothetical protein n=1 Tax=Asanoa sp. NPDC050611 TaxID=3157098 RepID=UPI0033EE932C